MITGDAGYRSRRFSPVREIGACGGAAGFTRGERLIVARRERPIRALKIRSKGSRFFQHAISSTRRERPIEATVALALARERSLDRTMLSRSEMDAVRL